MRQKANDTIAISQGFLPINFTMDELLAPLRDAVEGQIVCSHPPFTFHLQSKLMLPRQDFHGQHLAELLSTILLIISGVSILQTLNVF
jgi:hypothetical protein